MLLALISSLIAFLFLLFFYWKNYRFWDFSGDWGECNEGWNIGFKELKAADKEISWIIKMFFNPNWQMSDSLARPVYLKCFVLFLVAKRCCGTWKIVKLLMEKNVGSELAKQKERIVDLLVPAGDHNHEDYDGQRILDDFVNHHEHWKGPDAFVLFGHGVTMVNRVQKYGTCYIHAVVVMITYLFQLMNHSTSTAMTNITMFIRRSFGADELCKHLFGSSGGAARDLLRKLLDCTLSDLPSFAVNTIANDCRKLLETYGPILVSHFRVTNLFMNGGVSFLDCTNLGFLRNPDGTFVAHAMVLVGVCTGVGGKTVFLLQNWWEDRQFIEVSAEYLRECIGKEGELIAVNKGITIQQRYETTPCSFSVSSCAGVSEGKL